MKNLMKALSLVAVVALVFACNKDQSCVNKLEGDWTLGDMKTWKNGTEVVDTTTPPAGYSSETTVTFTKYKVTEEEESGMVYTTTVETPGTGQTATTTKDTSDYKIMDKCTKIWMGQNTAATTDDQTADIIEATGSKFVTEWEETIGSDTYKYQRTLNKK